MRTYQVGEEVRFDGEVYVVSARSRQAPFRYRLLASKPDGTRFVWADERELSAMESYLRAFDDTRRY
ncbi:MAG: hypothetical protein WD314_11875 [Trueperaceae bacterium]